MSMVLRKLKKVAPGPKYTPLFSTKFEEFAASVAPGGTTGWGQVAQNTASMRPITYNTYATSINRYNAVRGMVVGSPASAVSNSRINRTETPPRATMYVRALLFFGTGGPRAGISFHGATGSGSTHIFYIQNVSGVDRLFWGTMASSTTTSVAPQTTATGMSGTTGLPVTQFVPQDGSGSTAKSYEVIARATSATTVDIFIQGVYVTTITTTFNTTGLVAGLYLASAQQAFCEEFEVGTWAAS